MTSTTKFPLGIYVGNPNGNDANANASFESQYNAFVSDMGGAKPLFMDAFVDFTQDPSQWASNASWTAWSWAQTGSAYVGPGSGITPVVGVPLASNAGGWGNVDTFYQQIISGQYDSDYKGIVDAWANQGYKTVQFRLGYEFDGNFMPWSPGNSSSPTANADFVAAFQHVANLVHSQSAADGITGQVVWNPADINWSATAPAALYPGNQYVDIISTDAYSPLYPNDTTSWSTNSTTQLTAAQFAANATDESHFWQYTNASQYNPTPGLTAAGWSFQDAVNLALQTGKPLSISETGQGPSPSSTLEAADDPAFANWLSGALSQAEAEGVTVNNVNIWDVNVGDGSWSFTDGSKPLAAAAWGADFGAGSGGSTTAASTAPLSTSSTSAPATTTAPAATTPAPAATPQPVTIGSGPNSLVLQVSEDAWQGDAQFTISVDGTQIGGTQTVTASHAAGQTETFTVLGTFATGSNTASINFLNDAYGGSAATDRNLYVNSATINGNAVSGAALTELTTGAQGFTFQQAAASAPPSVVFTDSAGHTLTQGTITTGTLDAGAWQTGMNNNLHQNATTGTDVISTESWGYVTTAQLTDLAGHSYAMQNFVEDDVHLGGGPTGSGQAASLALTTAERGTVQIDSGNYNVNVTAVSNTATPSANTFAITFGSGTDTLSLTGGSDNTVANVHAGSGTDTISFVATNSTTVTGGSGTANVNEAGGTNTVIAGTGTLNVHDGSGHDLLVFHAGGGLINATGFSAANGDTLQIDASLQSSMHQTTSAAGTMISFGNNTASGIMLQGVNSLSSSAIHFA